MYYVPLSLVNLSTVNSFHISQTLQFPLCPTLLFSLMSSQSLTNEILDNVRVRTDYMSVSEWIRRYKMKGKLTPQFDERDWGVPANENGIYSPYINNRKHMIKTLKCPTRRALIFNTYLCLVLVLQTISIYISCICNITLELRLLYLPCLTHPLLDLSLPTHSHASWKLWNSHTPLHSEIQDPWGIPQGTRAISWVHPGN